MLDLRANGHSAFQSAGLVGQDDHPFVLLGHDACGCGEGSTGESFGDVAAARSKHVCVVRRGLKAEVRRFG